MNEFSQIYTDPISGQRYLLEPALYPFQRQLAANTSYADLSLFFERDCPVMVSALAGSKTGEYSLQIQFPSGKWFNSSPIKAGNMVGTAQFPVAFPSAFLVPPGGRIGLVLEDKSGDVNDVELLFIAQRLRPVA